MKIGVISDTHLTRPVDFSALMNGAFKDVELIVHAGDLTELSVLDGLAGKKVMAVCGNMDSPGVRRQLPAQRVFEAAGFKIGLIHGWGGPQGIEERIAQEFEGVNCIVYGHTHAPVHLKRDGILFFNPGTFSGIGGSGSKTVGVLELGDTIRGQIFACE